MATLTPAFIPFPILDIIYYFLLNNKRTYQNFTNNFNIFLTQFLFYFNTILIQKILIFDFLISESLEKYWILFLGFKNVKNEKPLIFQHSLVFNIGGDTRIRTGDQSFADSCLSHLAMSPF